MSNVGAHRVVPLEFVRDIMTITLGMRFDIVFFRLHTLYYLSTIIEIGLSGNTII